MTGFSKEYLSQDNTLTFRDRKLWVRLASMFRGYTWMFFVSLICVLLMQLLPQFYPQILKDVVDGPVASGNLEGITPYIWKFLILIGTVGVLHYLANLTGEWVALGIIHRLRTQLFERLQTYHMDFFKRTPIGRLMTRLTNDVDSLNAMFAQGFIDLAGALLMLVLPVFFIFKLDWRMALASLAVTPLILIITGYFRKKIREVNKKIRASIAALNTRMQENLAGNFIVQIFGKTDQVFSEFDRVNSKLLSQWEKNVQYYSAYFPAINIFTELSLVMMYGMGAWLFMRDQVSMGTIMAFSWYMGMFWRPLREISDKYTMLQSALAAAERVFTLFDIHAQLPQGKLNKISEPVEISFKNVSFQYEPDVPVLKNIHTVFKQGETVAIVGATGGGKSTLISLCNYFYPPSGGEITVNGKPIQDYTEEALRHTISFIPQDVTLFAETIGFNIALNTEVDWDKVRDTCRFLEAHQFIEEMPDGYRTVLRERGENLSTGQRQLLAMARALYHEPKILLLDEATSSIDTASEELIQTALQKITRNFTCIVVAHRLSTIKNAQKILVMQMGEIVEEGTHDQLLKKAGIYQKMYKMQNLAFKI